MLTVRASAVPIGLSSLATLPNPFSAALPSSAALAATSDNVDGLEDAPSAGFVGAGLSVAGAAGLSVVGAAPKLTLPLGSNFADGTPATLITQES